MAYCTFNDIKEQLPEDELTQLTDDSGAGTFDPLIVDRAIADADAEINGYCGERYTVPFDPVPAVIRKFSVDISIYNLFSRRQGADEDRRNRYRDAIRFLQNLSKGFVTLGVDAPVEIAQDTVSVTTTKNDRIFSMGRSSDNSIGSMDNY